MAESAETRVFLVVVDETAEHHLALRYAARRAAHTGGRLALLHVIERGEFQHWVAVEELAAGMGSGGPGPLVTFLSGKPAARLRIPITIVPGGLTAEQIDALS